MDVKFLEILQTRNKYLREHDTQQKLLPKLKALRADNGIKYGLDTTTNPEKYTNYFSVVTVLENQIFEAISQSRSDMEHYQEEWRNFIAEIGMQKDAPMKYLLQHVTFHTIYDGEIQWT